MGRQLRRVDAAFEPRLRQHRSPLSGNAILRGRDKGAATAPEIQSTLQRQNARTNPRQFGTIRDELGNLCLRGNALTVGEQHLRRLGLLYPGPRPTAENGKSAKASTHAKHDKPVAAHLAGSGQSLPKDWNEIDINHLVLAKDDSQWGAWWEAIPVEKAGDLFKLRWREKHAANVPLITRPRLDLALIYPDAP